MSDLRVISGDGRDALREFHLTGVGGETGDGCTPALAGALRGEAAALERKLTGLGTSLVPGVRAVVDLYTSSLTRRRETIEKRFRDELRLLLSRLTRHLQLDASHSPEGTSASALAGELGRAGASIDAEALSSLLPEHRGAKRLSPERRSRLERAGELVRDHVERATPGPAIVVLHSGLWPDDSTVPGVEVLAAENAIVRAVAEFDEAAAKLSDLLRAVRLVRLELAGAFAPGRHERALACFDWRSATLDELALFPRVAVLERADRIRSEGIGELSTLLTSGRPVHVLLVERTLPPVGEAAGSSLEIGYVAAAHREAFVLQSTLARPDHLVEGFESMLRSPRPSVAIVASPSSDGGMSPETELLSAFHSRATPCFKFDPDAGSTWAACLEVEGNPQPERSWPLRELPIVAGSGTAQAREEAFTPAHALALHPAGRGHLRRVPRSAWADDQLEVAQYLELDGADRRAKLPFLWVPQKDGTLGRAVVTRELIGVCDDRLAVWRLLTELSGIENEHARRAAEEVRGEIEARAEESRRQLVAQHEAELARVRQEAGHDAVGRIVSALTDFDGEFPVETDAPPAAVVVEPAAAEAPVAEPAVATEPYIDSPLCTTCNECTNLNSRMFRYNEDKQAYVADATAGTYAELVKAAEKCPARCIHPGLPRAGDPSANERLLARAARFN